MALAEKLISYHYFFEKVLYHVCRQFLKETVTVVELRHTFGLIYDDDGNFISLDDEMQLFVRVRAALKERFPMFALKIIAVGQK